jgi:hypothetical protein
LEWGHVGGLLNRENVGCLTRFASNRAANYASDEKVVKSFAPKLQIPMALTSVLFGMRILLKLGYAT